MAKNKANCTQTAEFAMRKPIICLMAVGIVIIFMTSFINGAGIPSGVRASQASGGEGQGQEQMLAEVPALMDKLRKNPKDTEALQELAEAFSRAQDWERATLFWAKVIDLMPNDINALTHRAAALIRSDRYHDAVADYEKILGIDPNEYHALYYLGMVNKYVFKEKDKARAYFQRVLDLKPQEKNFIKSVQEEMAEL